MTQHVTEEDGAFRLSHELRAAIDCDRQRYDCSRSAFLEGAAFKCLPMHYSSSIDTKIVLPDAESCPLSRNLLNDGIAVADLIDQLRDDAQALQDELKALVLGLNVASPAGDLDKIERVKFRICANAGRQSLLMYLVGLLPALSTPADVVDIAISGKAEAL